MVLNNQELFSPGASVSLQWPVFSLLEAGLELDKVSERRLSVEVWQFHCYRYYRSEFIYLISISLQGDVSRVVLCVS